MKKIKKSAAENLLKAVLDDLKVEGSLNGAKSQETAHSEHSAHSPYSEISSEDTGQATEIYNGSPSTQPHGSPGSEDQDKTALITSIKKGEPPPASQKSNSDKILEQLIEAKRTSMAAVAKNPMIQNAEYSRLAQEKIVELEKQNEILLREHERLVSEIEVVSHKNSDLQREKDQLLKIQESFKSDKSDEVDVYREALDAKNRDYERLRSKVDELENRLKQDFRKTRSRERELENLLEISKSEKSMITKYKDEMLLEQKRKNDILNSQLESQRGIINELSNKIENYQEQFSRTVRALRLALTQLEVHQEETTIGSRQPIKKAE